MGSIYLIRHGQASFGADDYDVLSPTGIRQAEILGDHLLNLGVRFDRVLSGGLRRQQHTARAALERLESSGLATPELEVDPAFNEFEADAVIRAPAGPARGAAGSLAHPSPCGRASGRVPAPVLHHHRALGFRQP